MKVQLQEQIGLNRRDLVGWVRLSHWKEPSIGQGQQHEKARNHTVKAIDHAQIESMLLLSNKRRVYNQIQQFNQKIDNKSN